MAGIYIHIPFCKQACHYCNFHFSTSLRLKNDFLQGLLKEILLQKDYLLGEPVRSIYFGGGTPSLLSFTELAAIMETLKSTHVTENDIEITFEANPDDIFRENLIYWKQCGINRLSIGIQSFFDEDLDWMNRGHSAIQAYECISLAQEVYFENLTIDLIYGVPSLTDERWIKNLNIATAARIPHLSCYALTVEPKTPLESLIRNNKATDVNADDQARQFFILSDLLSSRGYEHYEISNFAKPGKRSRHNSAYWHQEKYLGIGPSAHSYNGNSRQWNISNNALYIQSLNNNIVPFEEEKLSGSQQLNEYIMTSLRTMEGLNLTYIRNHFQDQDKVILKSAGKYIGQGLLLESEDHLVLSREGKIFADKISSDLFVEEL